MNDKKFCFIICTNNAVMLEECIHYLNHLIVPDGYETDLLTIEEASSMTRGYNEAMQATDAKYKIYMHQDVFVLNKFLLQDILDIFASDEKIGMIGMVGYERLSPSGVMWHEKYCGSLYISRKKEVFVDYASYRYQPELDGYTQVAVIDGLMMITCRDIEWDTEDIDGWDFYDVYQSMRFIDQGYKIVVPTQRHPWCLHDDGMVLNMVNYDKYRQKYFKRYKDKIGKTVQELYAK